MRGNFRVKRLGDGRAMLNLGCGFKMDWGWNNLDFSLYARLGHHKLVGRFSRGLGLLSKERYQRLLSVDPEIIVWDLRKGIPFPDQTFEVVYHSHLLEHLDRDSGLSLLKECHRVLKIGGIIRAVVPDLETLISRYNSTISRLEKGDKSILGGHQQAISDLFDQMVQKQITGQGGQSPFILAMERFLRGDTAKIGRLHRWMYDKYSLETLLSSAGFKEMQQEDAFKSRIEGWSQFNLDNNQDGTAYKPESIYIEGIK